MEKHGTDELVRSFTTKRQLLALLLGQFSGAYCCATSKPRCRAIRRGFIMRAAPARSTFADANRGRDSRVFSGLFTHMLGMTTCGLRHKMGDAVRLIDFNRPGWRARAPTGRAFRPRFAGPRRMSSRSRSGCSIYHMITEATVNDIVAAKTMPIESGANYVFDLGYYDYGWWARSTRRTAASSRGSRRTRRSFRPDPCPSSRQPPGERSIAFCRADRPRAAKIPCKARCARPS